MSKALLYDATLCIGCKQCEAACAEQNKLPYDDKVAAEEKQSEHKFTAVLSQGRQVHAAAVHELRGSRVRLGLSGRRAAQDRRRPGDLRREPLHGLPLLHGGLSVQRAEIRMGQG